MAVPKPRLIAPFVAICALITGLLATGRAHAQVTPLGQTGCPAGTVVSGDNFVFNGDFSQGSTGFETDLPDAGPGVYPSDPVGGFSIQTGEVSYFRGGVVGRPFGGDTQREVPPSQTYFYSNPNQNKDGTRPFRGVLWRQTVTGLLPDTPYNFYGYFDNLLLPSTQGEEPQIELRVDGIAAGPAITVFKQPDTWIPIQYSFRTALNQTSAVLEVYSLSTDTRGNDFGMTSLSLRQCSPALGVAKQAQVPTENQDGSWTVTYRITVQVFGNGSVPLTNIQVTDNLAQTFAAAAGWSVVSLTSPSLTVNPAYDGRADIRLLSGNDQLLPGAPATINLSVRVTPGAEPGGKGPFFNSVAASGRAGSALVQDASTPGANPDPNGNSDPKEGDEDKPTPITLQRFNLFIPIARR